VLGESDLHPYQCRAVDFILERPQAALWIDMGLGKTVSTLTALRRLIAEGKTRKALVIAPLRVAQHTWPSEVKGWAHLQDLKLSIVAGLSAAKRLEAVKSDAPIHVINRENVPWLVDLFGQRWPYDTVVIDESSSFKNTTAKRWRALRKVLGKVSRMVQLTGTPAPNTLLELWPQMYLLDRGERLENTKGKFIEKYCRQVGNPSWNQYEVRADRVEAIYRAVSDVVLRMSSEDYLQLPERIEHEVTVRLPRDAKRAYEDLERDFILKVESGEITAANAAVQVNKLLQLCNGAVYDAERQWHELHHEKLDALEELIEAADGPVLVAYHFKADLERIQRRLSQAAVLDKDPETIERWNRGEIPVLLAHPASAGHGLNLQRGGSIIMWFGLSWSLELYQQFNARLYRQGQEKPVRIYHILADTRAEKAVLDALKIKDLGQNSLLDFVKRIRIFDN